MPNIITRAVCEDMARMSPSYAEPLMRLARINDGDVQEGDIAWLLGHAAGSVFMGAALKAGAVDTSRYSTPPPMGND